MSSEFKHAYESCNDTSYMVIAASGDKRIVGYQVEILALNSIQGVLPVDMRLKDGSTKFYYNITSKISLEQFLRRRKLGRNEFLAIISGITKTLLDCRDFLLYDRCFVLKEDMVYIVPDKLTVELAYIPVDFGTETGEELKNFLLGLIMGSADIDEGSGDNFLQKIISCLKGGKLNITQFHQLLLQLLDNTYQVLSTKNQTGIPLPDDRNEKEENRVSKRENPIPEKKKLSGSGEDKPVKKLPIHIVIQLPIGMLCALLILFLNSQGAAAVENIAALLLIVGAADVLLIKNLAKGDKKPIEKKEPSIAPVKEKKTAWSITQVLEGAYEESFEEAEKESAVIRENSVKRIEPLIIESRDERNIINVPDSRLNPISFETTLLSVEKQQLPYLKSTGKGMVEKIYINKPNFVIGRLKEQVDYISENKSIGKVHAEIIEKDESYYIKDLNSRNGTYINSERIECNKEYEIKDKDIITLANSEYEFVCTC